MVKTFAYDYLKEVIVKILVKTGVEEKHAIIVADNLIEADLKGVSSHGISRLSIYIKRLNLNLINKNPVPKIEKSSLTTYLIDGDNGLGQVIASEAMKTAIKTAKETGSCFVGVKNTNHIGMGAYYAEMAAKNGLVGFVFTNASAFMAPWGGSEAILGTNPITIAVPSKDHSSIILDIATSAAARGKVLLAEKKGEKIPFDWALDQDGNQTDDPSKARLGTMLPLGGPKGYGLSLMVDILAGVLTGASFGKLIPSMTENFSEKLNIGVFLGIVNIENFMPVQLFEQRIQELITQIKSSKKKTGVKEIFLPGEIEERNKTINLKNQIPINDEVILEINRISDSLGIKGLV